ncbi:MAG: hypothetical protein ACLFR2_08855, partial [Candidatus Kapaibacterium sp.]
MKNFTTILLAAALIGAAALLISWQDSKYFQINSSFEIFGDLYKKIANNYVIDVDPELLMESAIEGMLSSLDPYTVYYTQSDYDELEYMTRGTYVGLGISVAIMDS